MISRFDGQFNTVWKKTFIGLVQQEAFQVTSDENYIIFAPFQTLSWTVVKMNSSDGSFNLQTSLTFVTQWQSVQLSTDNTSIYLAGYSTGPYLVQMNLSDLSVVNMKTHSSLQIISIYFYSSSILLVNSINLLNTNYQISAVDMSLSSGSLLWGNKFGWTLVWSTPVTPMLSLIWTSTNQSFQLIVEGGLPVFFVINLSTGSVSGSFYTSSSLLSGISTADLSYTDSTSTIYILMRYSSGFYIYEYYPSSNTFSNAKKNTSILGYFATVKIGFTYFGGQLISNSNAYISKVIENGNVNQQQTFSLTSTSDTFSINTSSGYELSSDITIIVAIGVNTLSSSGTLSFISEGSYTQSSTGIFRSDIVYRNGFQDSLYVQENYSGKIEFQYPCSTSGENVVSSTLIAHPTTGTYPAWISLNSDYEHINVISPSYGASNVYYFGVRSIIFGENIDKYATITVYQCLVSNWASCFYTTNNKWSFWNSGYSLSSDATIWSILSIQSPQNPQSSQTSTNNQPSQNSTHTNSQTLIDENTLYNLSLTTAVFMLISPAVCILGVTLGFSPSQGIWSLFNQYQLILMLPFLRTDLPKDFFVFIRNLVFVTFDFSFLNTAFLTKFLNLMNVFDYEQSDKVYYDNGMESGSFIINQFNLIQVGFIVFILHLWWLAVSKLIRCSSQKIKKLKQKIFNYFHFNTYLRITIESFLFSFIAAFTEALRLSEAINSKIPIASYAIGWIFTLFYFAFALFVLFYYWKKKEKVDKVEWFSELYDSFKKTHFSKLYFVVFTTRRILIVMIVVLCKNLNNNYKLLIYLLLQIVSLIYTLLILPFEYWGDCIMESTNDSIYTIIVVLLIVQNNVSSNTKIANSMIMTLVMTNGAIIFLEACFIFIFGLLKKLTRHKYKTQSLNIRDRSKPKDTIRFTQGNLTKI